MQCGEGSALAPALKPHSVPFCIPPACFLSDDRSTDVGSSDGDNTADSSSSQPSAGLCTAVGLTVAASPIVAAPRALRNNLRGQPRHHSDPIGRTCKYRYGGKVYIEVPTAPWGKLKYTPLKEP